MKYTLKVGNGQYTVEHRVYAEVKAAERTERRLSYKVRKNEIIFESESEIDKCIDPNDKPVYEVIEEKELLDFIYKVINNDLSSLEQNVIHSTIINNIPKHKAAKIMNISYKKLCHIESCAIGKIRNAVGKFYK